MQNLVIESITFYVSAVLYVSKDDKNNLGDHFWFLSFILFFMGSFSNQSLRVLDKHEDNLTTTNWLSVAPTNL